MIHSIRKLFIWVILTKVIFLFGQNADSKATFICFDDFTSEIFFSLSGVTDPLIDIN